MPYSSFSDQNHPMNSPPPPLDPLSSAASASTARRRGSTSQMCLQRILNTIATVPPPPLPTAETAEEANAADDAREFSRFDSDSTEAKKPPSSSSGGDGGDCDVDVDCDRDERSLSLLIEAAKLILGEFVDEEKSELEKGDAAAAAAEIGADFGDSPPSPVVRSKRGRTRVMPCRYRDSVLEPLPRFSRTGSTVVAAKRRRG